MVERPPEPPEEVGGFPDVCAGLSGIAGGPLVLRAGYEDMVGGRWGAAGGRSLLLLSVSLDVFHCSFEFPVPYV